MSKNNVLVVGAGALGISVAYHLQLAGADVSFLVRRHRFDALARPQRLYCMDDHQQKSLSKFDTIVDLDSLAERQFDFILLTLDGALCRGEAGVTTLAALGRYFSGSQANLIICGVGIGLYDHVKQVTGFPEHRLLQGSLGSLAYQVDSAEMPLHPSTNGELLAQCDIAYHHFSNRVGFFMSREPRRAAKAFARLYNRCGVSRCSLLLPNMYAIVGNAFFPITTACEIIAWQGAETLIADPALWPLVCGSMREIAGLREHGWTGKAAASLMSNKRVAKILQKMDADSQPLDFNAFNRFHHGSKVQAQDIQVMENCLSRGEDQGRDMSCTQQLLQRWRDYRATA